MVIMNVFSFIHVRYSRQLINKLFNTIIVSPEIHCNFSIFYDFNFIFQHLFNVFVLILIVCSQRIKLRCANFERTGFNGNLHKT